MFPVDSIALQKFVLFNKFHLAVKALFLLMRSPEKMGTGYYPKIGGSDTIWKPLELTSYLNFILMFQCTVALY